MAASSATGSRARGATRRLWCALVLLQTLVGGCSEGLLDPLLEAVLPDHGVPGAAVDIVGDRLEGQPLGVSLGGLSTEVTMRQPRRLRFTVPVAPSGAQLLVVTIDGRVSNALTFTVDGRPDASP